MQKKKHLLDQFFIQDVCTDFNFNFSTESQVYHLLLELRGIELNTCDVAKLLIALSSTAACMLASVFISEKATQETFYRRASVT